MPVVRGYPALRASRTSKCWKVPARETYSLMVASKAIKHFTTTKKQTVDKRPVISITRGVIHNGPGMRTLILLKGCPLRCLWCSTPESQDLSPEIALDRKNCIRCGHCLLVCPSDAIFLENDSIGIRRDRCDNCGKCAEVCSPQALKLLGQYWSVEELVGEVQKDALLFKHSGGGVTISGGEPLLDLDFIRRLLAALKGKGISTCVDTSGYVPWSTIECVSPYVDFFLWDIKHMNSDKHRQLTGVPNALIIDNARKASDRGVPMYIRVPVIPGCNDSEDNIRAMCEFTRSLRSVVEVHLLPFHHLGRARYESLDYLYSMDGTSLISDDAMRHMQLWVESYGLKCRIGG